MKLSQNVVRLAVFAIFTIVSIGIVLFLTVNKNTVAALGHIRPVYLLACFGFWVLSLACDSCSNLFFVRGADERIGLFDAVKLAAIRIFFNLITPFTSGGQPVSIYILSRLGVHAGKGSSIIVTRLMCISFFSTCGAIIAFVFSGDVVTSNETLQATFFTTGIIALISYGIAITGLLCLPVLRFIVRVAGRCLAALRIVKDREKFVASGVEQAAGARDSFKNYFTRHPVGFLLGFISCAGWYACQVLILFFILRGLGIRIMLVQGFVLSALLIFLISLAPTPGGSGLGELLFFLLFAGTVTKELVGVSVILWRIFYQYITAMLGAIFTVKYFRVIWKKLPENSKASPE
jgi:uncharacterized protein (TIRG00374 family)